MDNWLQSLINPHIRELTPYQSARRLFSADGATQQVWLNANEAPDSPDVQIDTHLFNRYPDCQPASLINAYASYANVTNESVIATRGADEGIELVIRAFCQSGKDSILICPPTYGMYAISAETFAVDVIKVPLMSDFSLDIQTMATYQDKVNVVFICSPNNPTGTLIAHQQIESVLKLFEQRAVVVVDEAYIEFCAEHSAVDLLSNFPNLVILRTLSKAFALAGIRCGFTLASPEIIQTLLKVIAPYPIPTPVARIAKQALNESGRITMKQRVNQLNCSMLELKERLARLPGILFVGASNANFVLFRHPDNANLMRYLVAQNLYIRDQSKQHGLQDCLRITVGSEAQNLQLIQAIEEYFETVGIQQ